MARIVWTEAEMILAADLADDRGWTAANERSPGIGDLSRLLQGPAFHPAIDRDPNFRSPASVVMKISNLIGSHPSAHGKGLRTSAAEVPIVEAFIRHRETMKRTAESIRELARREEPASEHWKTVLADAFDGPHHAEALAAQQGGLRALASFEREQRQDLREAKIQELPAAQNPLMCEVCASHLWDPRNAGSMRHVEFHHVIPRRKFHLFRTELSELVPLCARCHPAIHSSGWISPADMRKLQARSRRTGRA
ncbi:HNH endonuclease [Brevibacterium luteolum]|uniref:HNH endonuclease n=1 Tax=Brevibacterium luteolum TaxID=199591 RepID=UPI00223BD2A6|nr:HNH endonuclease [Brevibacterium luteolum]MCT1828956.1 hypothetical protein [Brevibacterium luteolum]